MAFTKFRLLVPAYSGDAKRDFTAILKSIGDHFLSLERPGALSIVDKGDWTPAITFATPGDVSVTYTTQFGKWWRIGDTVTLNFYVLTSAFTHTTASGALQMTGNPFTSQNTASFVNYGSTIWRGITKANYTQVNPGINNNASNLIFLASGSGQATSSVAAADMPTGGTVFLNGSLTFQV